MHGLDLVVVVEVVMSAAVPGSAFVLVRAVALRDHGRAAAEGGRAGAVEEGPEGVLSGADRDVVEAGAGGDGGAGGATAALELVGGRRSFPGAARSSGGAADSPGRARPSGTWGERAPPAPPAPPAL